METVCPTLAWHVTWGKAIWFMVSACKGWKKKKSEIRPLGLFAVHVLNALSWDEAGKGYCMEFLCAGGHVLCKEALNVIPITHKTKQKALESQLRGLDFFS